MPYILENEYNYYVVKKNDTLYDIAKKYNVSVKDIKDYNGLVNNLLQIGQKLIIPKSQDYNTKYIVKKNDSLYKIAQKFDTSIEELKNINKLTSNLLYIGQELIIPQNNQDYNDYYIYTVKEGDSLWKIANKFNVTIPQLTESNKLINFNLKIGQKLIIPINKDNEIYIVKKGDTLWSIARENDINVSDIKKLNKLSNNLLQIGQKLILK